MAKNDHNPLEQYIRSVVSEVLIEKFGSRETTAPQRISFAGGANRRKVRKFRTGKGAVTDPSKDKRLKQNRGK